MTPRKITGSPHQHWPGMTTTGAALALLWLVTGCHSPGRNSPPSGALPDAAAELIEFSAPPLDVFPAPDRPPSRSEIVSLADRYGHDQAVAWPDVLEATFDAPWVPEDLLPDSAPDLEIPLEISSAPEDLSPLPDELQEQDGPDVPSWTCPFGTGYCIGLTWYWCNNATQTEHETDCTHAGIPCKSATCTDGIGCQFLPDNQLSCNDGNQCTTGDHCVGGLCLGGKSIDCDDGNPCTDDSCSPGSGSCLHLPNTAPCDDSDSCTSNDTCLGGVCGGVAITCPEDAVCQDGFCVPVPSYPPGPYGTYLGDTLPNQTFLDPSDLSSHNMAEFWGSEAALLITFNAGWCKVCKEDTVLLNNWVESYGPDGLAILSILYETPNGEPITQGFAQWWQSFYQLAFPLWLDTPVAAPNGDATGGALAAFRQPNGPVEPGYFPVTVVVCPATMKILYVSKGFYDDVVTEALEHWLYVEDCATGLAY